MVFLLDYILIAEYR